MYIVYIHAVMHSLILITLELLYSLPPTSLLPGVQYSQMAAVFGAQGYHATSIQELQQYLAEILAYKGTLPQLLNVEILPSSLRKPQVGRLVEPPSFYRAIAII